jgi:hypothetical protein
MQVGYDVLSQRSTDVAVTPTSGWSVYTARDTLGYADHLDGMFTTPGLDVKPIPNADQVANQWISNAPGADGSS